MSLLSEEDIVMDLAGRVSALVALGEMLSTDNERLQAHVHRASVDNGWFTLENISFALREFSERMLSREILEDWTRNIKEPKHPKRAGVIMAGNLPAVGFHDLLCVFTSGNIAVVKLSEKDKILIPFFLKLLGEIDGRTASYFEIVDKLQDIDAVIATGSNNSARYFEYYFSKYPHIIRRNRNAIAVLDGTETDEELAGLCDDIFIYFGLGCRSVSYLYVPHDYDFAQFIAQTAKYAHLANHSKYRNNLDYNLALQILNKSEHIALPNLIMLQSDQWISPVGTLHYGRYQDINALAAELSSRSNEIQCLVAHNKVQGLSTVPFGKAQQPPVNEYADGIDTLNFLQSLY